MQVALIDYGSGNLRSAAKAFERAAAEHDLTAAIAVSADPSALDRASHIVLPGVGAFADCMAGLRAIPGMIDALERNVQRERKPFLGICVGMQLLAERGHEHGVHEGLGWLPGDVRRIDAAGGLKVPHMGWNELLVAPPAHAALAGIAAGAHAYFLHSYHFAAADPGVVLARVEYGEALVAMVGRGNILGTQFHPEKSQAVGLRLLANFLAWRPR